MTKSYFNLRDQSDADRNLRIIQLLNQEKEKRSLELKRLQNDARTLAAQAAVKDPFAAKTDSRLVAEAPAGRPGEPAGRRSGQWGGA